MHKVVLFFETIWSLLRFETYILLAIHVLLTCALVAVESGVSFSDIVDANLVSICGALLLTGFWYVQAAAINDLADFEIDIVNKLNGSDRPLAAGRISKRELTFIVYVVSCIVLVMSALISVISFAATVVVLFLSWAYSMRPLRISYRGSLASLLLPVGYVLYPCLIALEAVDSAISLPYVLLVLALYTSFISRVMLKDFRDVAGDLKFGKMTFLLRHSQQFVVLSSAVLFFISCGLYIALLQNLSDWPIGPFIAITGTVIVGLELFIRLKRCTSWKTQKVVLPYLSRVKSTQAILILVYLLYLSGELSSGLYTLGFWGLSAALWVHVTTFRKSTTDA